ncbi:MAG: ABC transporter ATP-binding protein [Spirochaetes bacterium]|nr:MAG: ABC transporter ATP-binding protein [Spirochaetota bacterium]
MLKVRSLSAGYGSLKVLRNVSLHVKPGEIVAIIGGNGSGKSTLLATIAGVVSPFAGEIVFAGGSIAGLPAARIVETGCCLVPEGRHVFAPMSVRENLLLGAYPLRKKLDKKGTREKLDRVYGHFPRLKERESQLAGTLSGGEQQMLAIGRALMSGPRLLMLDEPSTGLAPIIVKDIFRIIARLRGEGNTILLVEQNARMALGIADRGYVLETGQIILEESSRELLDNRDVQRAYLGKEYRSISE